jgi:general secretion pathway protein K
MTTQPAQLEGRRLRQTGAAFSLGRVRARRRGRQLEQAPTLAARSANPRRPERRERGVALVMVLTVIAMIAVFVADMSQNTTVAFQMAVAERDRIKAEYLARSGLNLTRLLIAQEPKIRQIVAPIYSMVLGHGPPQINVWSFADTILKPFADYKGAKEQGASVGIDFSKMAGIKDTGGTFEIKTITENSMINLNKPLFYVGDEARTSIAMQLFALMGGYQTNSPYDVMFQKTDSDGQLTSRLDIVSAAIDWWDDDEQRTVFDPGGARVTSAGREDDLYSRFTDPYRVKNAPYDSLEELRLIRGFNDDFWATFIQPDPEDPASRRVTIYGSGAVNPNEARAEVLWSRVCSFVSTQPLCQDPTQRLAFVNLFDTARMMLPIALFEKSDDFLNFMEGKGNARDLYPMLKMIVGQNSPLLAWQPIVVPPEKRQGMRGAFVTAARIFTMVATGHVNKSTVRINTVLNFDENWTPPPLTIGKMNPLGLFHRYRIE